MISMVNRNLGKGLAIALGALIGGAGALNAVPVSAGEHLGQPDNIVDIKDEYEAERTLERLIRREISYMIVDYQREGKTFKEATDLVKNEIPNFISSKYYYREGMTELPTFARRLFEIFYRFPQFQQFMIDTLKKNEASL